MTQVWNLVWGQLFYQVRNHWIQEDNNQIWSQMRGQVEIQLGNFVYEQVYQIDQAKETK